MANLCSNNMEIFGDEKILDLGKKIKAQNKKIIALFPWFEYSSYDYGLWEDTLLIDSESIVFSYGSKWRPPIQELTSLFLNYPTFTFKNTFEESGMEIFGEIHGENGVLTVHDMTPLEYYTQNDEDFSKQRNFIEKAPYKIFLKNELTNPSNELKYYYLEPLIINRLKTEDLPLFINRKWIDSNAEKLFPSRLKGENDA